MKFINKSADVLQIGFLMFLHLIEIVNKEPFPFPGPPSILLFFCFFLFVSLWKVHTVKVTFRQPIHQTNTFVFFYQMISLCTKKGFMRRRTSKISEQWGKEEKRKGKIAKQEFFFFKKKKRKEKRKRKKNPIEAISKDGGCL